MKNITNILIQESIFNAVKHYGLEGTWEAINKVYSRMPKTRDILLKEFSKIYSLALDKTK